MDSGSPGPSGYKFEAMKVIYIKSVARHLSVSIPCHVRCITDAARVAVHIVLHVLLSPLVVGRPKRSMQPSEG